MKKILSILIIAALSLVTFNANAQDGDVTTTTVYKSEKNQTVMKDSYRKYVITPSGSANSTITWTVTNPSVNKFYDLNADGEFVVFVPSARETVVYVKWGEGASLTYDNSLIVIEESAVLCSDLKVNAHKINVKIIENDFKVMLNPESLTGKDADHCAINDGTGVKFVVTRSGGDIRNDWNFKYQYRLNSTDDADWKDSNVYTRGSGTSVDMCYIDFVATADGEFKNSDLVGDGTYKIEVRIIEAHDHYMTNAALPAISSVIINMIPATQEILLD